MVISFDDVSFRPESGRPILVGVNLTIDSGEIVAVVGRSGAGLFLRGWDLFKGATR